MNRERRSPSRHPTLGKRAEAAAWLARLHGPGRSTQVERGFQRWLRADAEHSRAFELLTERLEVVERLRGRPLSRRWLSPRHGVRSRLSSTLIGMAAGLSFFVIGAILYSHNRGIATHVGEQRTLTLADGSHIYLNTDTRVVVRFDERKRTIELKRGEALFEVAKQAERPFVVVAGERNVVALGTTFVVRRDSDRTAITLIEGKVAVKEQPAGFLPLSAAASEVPIATLSPGDRLTLAANQPARRDHPSLAKVTAWRQGQVALEDMPLSEAAEEMNRYSSIRVVVERPEAALVRVGGFFRMGDSASFVRAVATTYGFDVIERPEEIVLAGLPRRVAEQSSTQR